MELAKMKHNTLLVLCVAGILAGSGTAANDGLCLLPKPASVNIMQGYYALPSTIFLTVSKVKSNRSWFESLAVTAAVGEHTALRRTTAVEVVKQIRQAEADLARGEKEQACSNLLKAAKAIRLMEEKHAGLFPRVKKNGLPYYSGHHVWWFSTPEAHDYATKLASRLEELAQKPDAEALHGILEAGK